MKRVAIIGAGISGLFIANLFKRNPNYQITIYEKNTSIALEEGYGVQLSVNSIKYLNKIGFEKLEINKKFTPKKIHFYSNKNLNKICELDITEFNSENCKYTTLKRSSLINFLKTDLEGLIRTGYNISKIDQKEKKVLYVCFLDLFLKYHSQSLSNLPNLFLKNLLKMIFLKLYIYSHLN